MVNSGKVKKKIYVKQFGWADANFRWWRGTRILKILIVVYKIVKNNLDSDHRTII